MAINSWASTAPFTPVGLTVAGNSLYAAYVNKDSNNVLSTSSGGQLEQISLANPTNAVNLRTYPRPISPATQSKTPFTTATDNTYIYISNDFLITIDRYEISTGNYQSGWYTPSSGVGIIGTMTVVNKKLYFWQGSNNALSIFYIDLTSANTTPVLFKTIATLSQTASFNILSLTNDGTYLYFPNFELNIAQDEYFSYIAKLNTMNVNDYNSQWVKIGSGSILGTDEASLQNISIVSGLTVVNGYLYAESILASIIINQAPANTTLAKISLTNPAGDIDLNWLSFLGGGVANNITNDGTYLYVANVVQQTISRFPLPATSNICFPAGTPIKTDQGVINIEKLQPGKHTIRNKPIEHVTQTVTLDKYLIAFEPSAVDHNVPTKKTIMTKDHCIAFNGQLVPAYRFLDHSDRVKKVTYSGEVLYNVLLAEHGVMEVNNMLCETLHPANLIAKIYKGYISPNEKTHYLQKNDMPMYKSLLHRLQ